MYVTKRYSFLMYVCTEPAPIVHEADVVTSDNPACSKVGQGVLQEVSHVYLDFLVLRKVV